MRKIRMPENVIDLIIQIIKEKRESEELKTRFPNKLLREDVLDLLDMYCTVVYYPIDNESNNGFHITGIPDKFGKDHHFVYINTSQTIEKQIFTAAHELGHVWEVDTCVLSKYGQDLANFCDEDIINRFAAELLMPQKEFLAVFDKECSEFFTEDGKTPFGNLLKIIATIMNHFFVPQKAVIYRLFELGRINVQILELLLGESVISENIISDFINDYMKENGHIRFLTPTRKKWIDGLAELLDKAEKNDTIALSKIEKMRKDFDLPKKQIESDMFEKIVDVSSGEGES